MKKSLIMAMCAFFLLSGIAMAANRVDVKLNSEPISKTSKEKAGSISLEFDKGTVLKVGDQITIDLPLNTSLANSVDLELSNGGTSAVWTAAKLDANDAVKDIIYTKKGATNTVNTTMVGAGVYFKFSGTAGQGRVTLDVMGAVGDSITVGPDDGDALVIRIFDQTLNAAMINPGLYVPADPNATPKVYSTAVANTLYNTLCINVESALFTNDKVNVSFDSKDDKFTFAGNMEIAHIVPAATLQIPACKTAVVGYITLGSVGTQSSTCTKFDYDSAAATGYCTKYSDGKTALPATLTHAGNHLIIQSDSVYANINYQVELTIKVNSAEGDKGVYWTKEVVNAIGVDDLTTACAAAPVAAVGAQASYTYLNGSGNALKATDIVAAPTNCGVTSVARATKLTTNESAIAWGSPTTNKFLVIDIPSMVYDVNTVKSGDIVSVQVKLIKPPCSSLFTGTFTVGTFGCPTASVAGGSSRTFPYFTAANASADSYWDGIVLTNYSSTAGTVTLTIYEKDGDVGTFTTPSIPANGMYVELLSNIVKSATKSSGSGTLGDSACYISATSTTLSIDGFAMIADSASGVSMGYLAR